MRCVYVLMIASDDEIPHVFSSDMPNGLDAIYRKVNEAVFGGRGNLQQTQPGFQFGNFTPMKTIHNATHVSFQSLLTWKLAQNSPESTNDYPERFIVHIETYRRYLTYIGEQFAKGGDKALAVITLKTLHLPASHWEEQSRLAKEAAAAKGQGRPSDRPSDIK
jgi:hypothetical protein